MTIGWQEQLRPGFALREIVQEATVALIRMDSARLEELARCCADLNREVQESGESVAAADLKASEMEMRLLGRVLCESRANLTVISRLYEIRLSQAKAPVPDDSQARGEPIPEARRSKPEGIEMLLWRTPESERTAGYGDN